MHGSSSPSPPAPIPPCTFVELERHIHETNLDIFTGMFPETNADPEFARVGLAFATAMLDGMALSRICGVEPHRIDEVREIFKLVVAPYFPLSTPPEGAPQ